MILKKGNISPIIFQEADVDDDQMELEENQDK